MSEQQTGQEGRPATGQDLYNFALKVDTNFTLLQNDMATGFALNSQELTNVRGEMLSEFKAVRAEMLSGFKEVRVEMKTGFDNVAQEFVNVRAEMLSGFKEVRVEMKTGFDNVAQESVNFRAEMRNELSDFKSSIVAWVASFGIAIISVTSGLSVAILLKM